MRETFVGQCRNVSYDGKEVHDIYGFRPRHLDYMWQGYMAIFLLLFFVFVAHFTVGEIWKSDRE